jgi:AcrR family transcriptional regulator
MKIKAKERLVSKALELFNRYGFNAVGIDTILKESGVAKNTLYRHFGSKEELIIAALRKHDEDFRARLSQDVEEKSGSPTGRIVSLFDAYEPWMSSHDFYGCLFTNASAEFPDADSPIHRVCAEHKQSIIAYVKTIVESEQFEESGILALRLLILLDGAVTYTYITGDQRALQEAKQVAKDTLQHWKKQKDNG